MRTREIVAATLALGPGATISAFGYVGPGAGITMLGSLWVVVLIVALAIGVTLYWPIRAMYRLWRRHLGRDRKRSAAAN